MVFFQWLSSFWTWLGLWRAVVFRFGGGFKRCARPGRVGRAGAGRCRSGRRVLRQRCGRTGIASADVLAAQSAPCAVQDAALSAAAVALSVAVLLVLGAALVGGRRAGAGTARRAAQAGCPPRPAPTARPAGAGAVAVRMGQGRQAGVAGVGCRCWWVRSQPVGYWLQWLRWLRWLQIGAWPLATVFDRANG